MIYVAWADGVLSGDEITRIGEILRAREGADGIAADAVDRWLNPARPPSPVDLAALLRTLRRAARSLSADERRSLAGLGAALARRGGFHDPAVDAALSRVEAALGVAGGDAVKAILAEPASSSAAVAAPSPTAAAPSPAAAASSPAAGPAPSAAKAPPDPVALERFLQPDHRDIRARVFALLERPSFRLDAGLPMAEHRRRVFAWLGELAEAGLTAFAYPEAQGGAGDVGASIAVFETLAYHDLSLVVKYGVQFGLFGGSILHLGTERHHERWLRDVASLQLAGCYAMTEVGHGSNVRDLRTVARYDAASGEFVVVTPDADARKDWIGNAALHARLATVFAQLEVGGQGYGVHALVVPIRDAAGRPLPGVEIEDCGLKEGLNGVDNGRLAFRGVRVPRDHLLDRFGRVTEDGRYESPIASDGRRFFTMLGTLVAGRISIAAAAGSVARTALAIAVRYTDRRRQFGPPGGAEVPVLDYLAQQRRLLPRLATTYALHFAVRDLVRRYADVRPGQEVDREIESLAAGLKAYGTQHTVETIQQCRQACGGRGYLAASRFGALLADTDVFTTFEGANLVLLQLVARGLLTRFREHIGDLRIWGLARYLGERAAHRVARLNPILTRRTDPEHLRDPQFQLDALRFREEHLVDTAARRLKRRIDETGDTFAAMNQTQDHLVAAARAHVERVLLERFADAVAAHASTGAAAAAPGVATAAAAPGVATVTPATTAPATAQQGPSPLVPASLAALRALRDLFALSRIEADRGWFLETGYIEASKAKAVRAEVNRLCADLRPLAVPLVEAFGIPESLLPPL